MFARKSLRGLISLVLLQVFFGLQVFGQIPEHELPGFKSAVMKSYEAGDYKDAVAGFNKLMDQFPKDAMYRYYAGVSMVKMDRDLEKAAELLYFASSRGVPVDVYYYLGEAYRRLYDFEKAKKFYIMFDEQATRSEARAMNSKLLINSVTSAMQLTNSYNPFEVLNVTFMNLQDPADYQQIKMKGGMLVSKPLLFYGPKEEEKDLNSLMFLPRRVDRGDYVYFAALEGNGRKGYQIMRSRKANAGKWQDPEPVNAVNTDLDEILPYFDPVGKDLYFASNGHEGIGGFDLYKSHYDEENDEWTDPMNLGFPINSVYDDYLLLPGTDLGMVMFFSGRQVTDTSMVVYRVHFSEPKKSLASSTPEEIRRVASLGGLAEEMVEEYEQYKEELAMSAVRQESMKGQKKNENAPEQVVDEEYQRLISSALKHQASSDSLMELATDTRVKVRDSDDPNDRWIYQKQIMVWEKRAEEERMEADRIFASVANYKPRVETKVLPEAIKEDTVINELTVYKFVTPDSISEKARNVFTPAEKEEEKVVQEIAEKTEETKIAQNAEPKSAPDESLVSAIVPRMIRFELLDASPYSANNPIPVDTPLPDGSFYRIQLGAFSTRVEPDAFGGFTPISGESIPDRGMYKYYVGKFNHYEDAQVALAVVRANGYPDAFIVSWYNGGKMSSDKTRKLEN